MGAHISQWHSLALIHVQIPVEIEVEQFELGDGLLSKRFRLLLLLLLLCDGSRVDNRAREMLMSIAPRMTAASREPSAWRENEREREAERSVVRESVEKMWLLLLLWRLPISPRTTLSPTPADLWMHLNLLRQLTTAASATTTTTVRALQESLHFFHHSSTRVTLHEILFFSLTLPFSSTNENERAGRRRKLNENGKTLKIGNEGASAREIPRDRPAINGKSFRSWWAAALAFWPQSWQIFKFFSYALITKSHSLSGPWFVIHREKPSSPACN
jgi:hypothetical protein